MDVVVFAPFLESFGVEGDCFVDDCSTSTRGDGRLGAWIDGNGKR
jgi:hypothetical protein